MDWELTKWILICSVALYVLWWINDNFFKIVVGAVIVEFAEHETHPVVGHEIDPTPYFNLLTREEHSFAFPLYYWLVENFPRALDFFVLLDHLVGLMHGVNVFNMEGRRILVDMYVNYELPALLAPITHFTGTYLRVSLLQSIANERTLTYQSMAVFFTIVLLLCIVLHAVSHLRSLSTSQDIEKRSEYECGFAPFDSATRLPFDVHFYLVGILFLVFDVEVSLMFPWAVGLLSVGWFGIFAMLVFVFVLTVGFVYEWQRGALIWPAHYSILQTSLADYKWSLPLLATLVCSEGILDFFPLVDPTTLSLFFVTTPLLASAPNKRARAEQKRKQRAEREIKRKQNQQARSILFAQLAKEEALAAEKAKPSEEQLAKAKEEAARLAAEEAAKKAAADQKAGISAEASAAVPVPAKPRDSTVRKILHKLRNPVHRLLGRNLTSFWPLTYLRFGEYDTPDLKWTLVNAEVDRKSRQKYDLHRLHPNQLPTLLPIVLAYVIPITVVLALFCVAVDFAIGDMRNQLNELWLLWHWTVELVHNFFVQNSSLVPTKGGVLEKVLTLLLLLPVAMYGVWEDYTREFIAVVAVWTYFFWYFTGSLLDRKISYYLVWRRKQLALHEQEEERARAKRRELGAIHPDKGRKDFNLGVILLGTNFDLVQVVVSTAATIAEVSILVVGAFALLDHFARFASKSPKVAQNGHPVFPIIGLLTVLLIFFTPYSDYQDSFWKGTAGLVAVGMYLYAACIYAARTFRLELWKGLYTRTFAFLLLSVGAFLFFATVYVLSEVHNEPMTKVALDRPYILKFGLPVAIVCCLTAIWYEYQYSAFRGRLITPAIWYGRKYLYRYSNVAYDRRFMFREELLYQLPKLIRARIPASRARRLAKRLVPIDEAVMRRAKARAAVRAAVMARAAKTAKAAPAPSKSTTSPTQTRNTLIQLIFVFEWQIMF